MKILVTGADGFIGKNLCARLEALKDGKDPTHPYLYIDEIFRWTRKTTEQEKEKYCSAADFVYHLAGINRPATDNEYMSGNLESLSELLNMLQKKNNFCPIMLAGSIQASLSGQYAKSKYGRAKLACENLIFQYEKETDTQVYVFRFPNVFGKWCKPKYNSVVATFCYNIARNMPICIDDPSIELQLLYIDDLINELLLLLEGKIHRCDYENLHMIKTSHGRYCYVPQIYTVTLREIADALYIFHDQPKTLLIPEQPLNSFTKKLYATYLSFLPSDKVSFPLKTIEDERGGFTELLKNTKCGQVSVNIIKPGTIKGQHWHNTKWELFIVVSGRGLIQERKIGSNEILEYNVSGKNIEAVHMLPGYTHNIINLSDTQDLVTIMWASEIFDPIHPDTYYEEV